MSEINPRHVPNRELRVKKTLSKLEEIRRIVKMSPTLYPLTKQLIEDGEIDMWTLNSAIKEDLFNMQSESMSHSPLPHVELDMAFNPKSNSKSKSNPTLTPSDSNNKTISLLSLEQIIKEEQAVERECKYAQSLAKDLAEHNGIAAARAAVSYIKGQGRNSAPSQALTKALHGRNQYGKQTNASKTYIV